MTYMDYFPGLISVSYTCWSDNNLLLSDNLMKTHVGKLLFLLFLLDFEIRS